MLKTKGSSINHKSYLKLRGFKKPLASLIFILLILTSVSVGNALADTSAASPGQNENGSDTTAQQNSSADEELENAVKEEADSGKIEITTTPNGSEIYINEISRGTTPARLTDVPPGFYEVLLEQEGYDDVFERVLVRPGETSVISKKLSFKEGVCSISSKPGEASVYLDGKYKGITPVVFHADEGTHSLKIKKTGYGTVSKEVNVSYDEPFVLKEKLHLSILVYLAAVLILLVGGVFIKKKPEIPEFKVPTEISSLEKYKKKLEAVGKREKKEKEKEKVWETHTSREKEIPGQVDMEVEVEEGVESGTEAEPVKLVELEKMSEPEFKYTVKKKDKD
ncbi:PEGA domain-containing protein [Methanosarcina sp. MTP4]|uniref:PEGA domain-containing protein n=1 Tax=Methanosarcina sp. MTP4 TaxID=1434100 RepID=UPI0009E5CBB1|nr:PEGA domain-containing protein [Methanosarcina sp. MTP4]